jgi:hypothetical protein
MNISPKAKELEWMPDMENWYNSFLGNKKLNGVQE